MTRKMIASGLVVGALLAGLAGVSAFVLMSDQTAAVPAAEHSAANAVSPAADSNGAALDLNNWQEARVTASGSNFKPRPIRR
jgi:hypothetical protein